MLAEWLTFQNSEEGENACSQMTYRPLGPIIISKLATLSDLKEQIMTLDGLSNFSIPTVKFLRLRLLQCKQLGRVLRLHLQTLQYVCTTRSWSKCSTKYSNFTAGINTQETVSFSLKTTFLYIFGAFASL